MLDEFNYKATFFIIANAVSDSGWADWKDLLDRGFEIGNHSLTHAHLGPCTDVNFLNKEINDSYDLISQKLSHPLFSFAHPYHSTGPLADQIIFQRHYATKASPEGFCNMLSLGGDFALEHLRMKIRNALAKGKWIVTSAHGIGDCYRPMSKADFQNFLLVLKANEKEIWIDTFEHLAKYKLESQNSQVTVSNEDHRIVIELSNSLDSNVFDFPLTLMISSMLPANAVIKSTGSNVPPEVIQKDDKTFIITPPSAKFEITW